MSGEAQDGGGLGHPASGGRGVEKEEDVNLTGLGQKSQGHTLSACLSCN